VFDITTRPLPHPTDEPVLPPTPTVLPTPKTPRRFLAGVVLGALIGGIAGGGVAALLIDDTDPVALTAPRAASTLPTVPVAGDVPAIVEMVGPGVVAIRTTSSNPGLFGRTSQGEGSGFIASSEGVIVTNNHVISDASQVTVVLADGREERAEVVGRDPSRDLAILVIDAENLQSVPLGSSDDLRPGDSVIAIGNALALGEAPTVTTGIVSAVGRTIPVGGGVELLGLIQTDAAINPGNSGGPLLNARGEVVGINTAVAGNAENIGFAIAIDEVKETIESAVTGDIERGPFLGVETVDAEGSQGALVVNVSPGSQAEAAGIRRGDMIVAVGDVEITNSTNLGEAIGDLTVGDTVVIEVVRGGEQHSLEVTIGERAGSLR